MLLTYNATCSFDNILTGYLNYHKKGGDSEAAAALDARDLIEPVLPRSSQATAKAQARHRTYSRGHKTMSKGMCANLGLPSHVGRAEAGLLGEVQGQQAEERATRAERSSGPLTIRMRKRSTTIRNITTNKHNIRMQH